MAGHIEPGSSPLPFSTLSKCPTRYFAVLVQYGQPGLWGTWFNLLNQVPVWVLILGVFSICRFANISRTWLGILANCMGIDLVAGLNHLRYAPR